MRQGKYTSTTGVIRYYKNDRLHREDGPALIMTTGEEGWFLFGLLHRIDGPAMYTKDMKHIVYYVHGRCHRVDGPALIPFEGKCLLLKDDTISYLSGVYGNFDTGSEYYYQHNNLHRSDGPAVITPTKERFFINGEHCTPTQIKQIKLKMFD
jgi:hypothetical protein